MTTIAYRAGVLAADTRLSNGQSMLGDVVKIARRCDGHMAAAAGGACYWAAFRRWFLAGEKGTAPKARDDERHVDRGVIFRPDGEIDVFEQDGSYPMRAPYFALGSGQPEATGAMFAGADAVTAVRAGMEHDSRSGGSITVLSHKGAKDMKKMMEKGIPMRKGIAMGMHEKMYPGAKSGGKSGKAHKGKPAAKGGRKGY